VCLLQFFIKCVATSANNQLITISLSGLLLTTFP
jgi:hypothetical protein